MKIFKVLFLAIVVLSLAVPAFATDLVFDKSLRVYNIKPATNSLWDINKVKLTNNAATFPIQQFLTTSTGSFAVYLLANYNYDITDQTIEADVTWNSSGRSFVTRGDASDGAYVRLEFQDVTAGPTTLTTTGGLPLPSTSTGPSLPL